MCQCGGRWWMRCSVIKAKCSVSSWLQLHHSVKPNLILFSCILPALQPCSVASRAKNATATDKNYRSRRLMFLLSFYFQTSHLLAYIIWHWVLGCSLHSHTALCVCLNQIFNLCNWNGWSNSALAFPQVFMYVCVCVCNEGGSYTWLCLKWCKSHSA